MNTPTRASNAIVMRLVMAWAWPPVLRLKERVVEIPELPLLVGAGRGARGVPRVPVALQREVDVTQTNLPGGDEAGANVGFGECREARAHRTLEVSELDDLERRC